MFGARRSQLANVLPWSVHVSSPDDIAASAGELTAQITAESPSVAELVVVIESVGELSGGSADDAVQELLKACRAFDHFVIAEGETSTLSGWGLMQVVKMNKYGMAMQPDDGDGDLLFLSLIHI